MIVKCETTRIIHSNDNFQLVACIPIGEYNDLDIHKVYHTISVKDNHHRLVTNKTYTLNVEAMPPSKYGTTYLLIDIPDLSFNKIEDITDKMEYELLLEIMSKNQAKYVHEAYPNFVRMVLEGDADKIDVSKIYNVSTKRITQYIRKVGTKYNGFLLRQQTLHYDLNQEECSKLLNIYDSLEDAIEHISTNPYHCLINLCGRNFRRADADILVHDIGFKYSDIRIEYLLNYAIICFEDEGSTYVDAERLGEYVYTLDADILPYIRDIAIKAKTIRYEEERNIIQRQSNYEQEKEIADFLYRTITTSEPLEYEWQKYKKIKDGELTEEQQNVLKMFCDYNVLILDAPSGTGKTSSLMALIHMIEDNKLTYVMMSPTGKAASRLSEQTGRPASTIHRGVADITTLTTADVIIIDESSMLSVPLMTMIIDVLKADDNPYKHRIVFVGDSAQIPSIGLGRIFKDMGESGMLPTCTLTKCFRFKEGGASYISTLTRQGEFYFTEEQLSKDRFSLGERKDYEFIRFNGKVEQIVDVYMELINKGVRPSDIVVLVPYNIGGYGATKLNNLIQSRINPYTTKEITMKTKHNDADVIIHANDLVMNTKNNYNAMALQSYDDLLWDDDAMLDDMDSTAVYNGQTGVVVEARKENNLIHGNILIVNIEGEEIIYTTKEVNNLLLGYASNPYKYQGSQCKYVINVVIGAHERAWNRQLLYTAQTRMTDKLIEIGDPQVIMEAVSKAGDDNRKTRLKEFLLDKCKEQ